MSVSALSLNRIRYRWPGQRQPCLDISEFTLARGERVFLHGPSGSGKSSLLGLFGGVTLPEQGQVSVLNHRLNTLSAADRDRLRADHIGFIFQQFNLLPWLSALDNVTLACTFSPLRLARAGDVRTEAERLMKQLDLAPVLWTKPAARLSVGQQQRVAAARALIGRPEILIADEPTSALDAPRQQAFIDLLLKEATEAGAALLFVSHDARLAGHFDRSIALDDINCAAVESVS